VAATSPEASGLEAFGVLGVFGVLLASVIKKYPDMGEDSKFCDCDRSVDHKKNPSWLF
jgi:hypothetical protein